jgi:serine protease Do
MVLTEVVHRFVNLESGIGGLITKLTPRIVAVQNGNGSGGSGVIWSEDLIITADHVVNGDRCRVVLHDGREFAAQIVDLDSENDLAALKIDLALSDLPSLSLADTTSLRPGQLVVAIGHPLGADWASTVGVISRLPAPGDRRRVLRASVTLLPGNSGGALFNAEGALLGINKMVSGPAEAFATPVDVVERLMGGR